MAKTEKETKEEKSLTEEIIDQMTKLATSGFGLVAALAWNEAIQALIKDKVESNEYLRILGVGLFYKFFYAILITFLIVLVTYYLSRLSNKIKSKSTKKVKG